MLYHHLVFKFNHTPELPKSDVTKKVLTTQLIFPHVKYLSHRLLISDNQEFDVFNQVCLFLQQQLLWLKYISHIVFCVDPCQDGEVRLVNDAFHNNEEEQMSEGSANFLVDSNMSMANAPAEGRIEICFRNVWGAIFDRNFTNKDAAVVCHQLGYDRYGMAYQLFKSASITSIYIGAIPTPFIYYGKTENVPFVLSSPVCNGYETSLLQCANDSTLPFGEANQYHDQPDHERNTAGVICERKDTLYTLVSANPFHGWYLLWILQNMRLLHLIVPIWMFDSHSELPAHQDW